MKKSVVVKTLAMILMMAPAAWAEVTADNSPAKETIVAVENVAAAPEATIVPAAQPAEEGAGTIILAQAGMTTTPAGEAGEKVTAPPEEKEEALPEEVEDTAIADPIEPFNRVMFHFNDKLYYWFFKPVAQGYNFVAPEPFRVSVRNFFNNVMMPIRLVNCVLQGKMEGAGNELARFGINTILGFGGFIDTAKRGFDIDGKNEDFGQTFGYWGLPQAMYIVWPILGPSNLPDSLGMAGNSFANPISYLPLEVWAGVEGYRRLNRISLSIGEYEDIVEASVEPYVALREAFVQHWKKAVRE